MPDPFNLESIVEEMISVDSVKSIYTILRYDLDQKYISMFSGVLEDYFLRKAIVPLLLRLNDSCCLVEEGFLVQLGLLVNFMITIDFHL